MLVALALAAGSGTRAHAQKSWDADIGFLGTYDFGGHRGSHFGFGFEVRAMYEQQQFDCVTTRTAYGGIAARLSILGWDQIRILVAPQAGLAGMLLYESIPLVTNAIGGELGFGYRLKRDPGPFLLLGLEGSLGNTVFLRGDYVLGRASETNGLAPSVLLEQGVRLTPSGSHTPEGSRCD